jgi:hypothetical protein
MQTIKATLRDRFRLTGDCGRQSTFLQGHFPELTDDDLEFEEGKEDELIKRIELRLNKTREEVVNYLKKGQLAIF